MKKSLSVSVILTAIAAVCLGSAVQAAEQGTTTGMATFHAQGDIQEFANPPLATQVTQGKGRAGDFQFSFCGPNQFTPDLFTPQ